MTNRQPLPRELGFRWPAEWETHAATWIAWPHQRLDWPGKFSAIPWVYAEIVRHLHQSENVAILVNDGASRRRALGVLRKAGIELGRIQFYEIPTDRVWTRDSGPTLLTSGEPAVAAVDWKFNAWAKYENWNRDDNVPAAMAKAAGWPSWQPICHANRVVLEGGSIDGNGAGTLLTTEECLLSEVQQRNPGMTRADYEKVFCDYLDVRKTIWLGQGITGDDTHGHIDDLARFTGTRTVVAVVEKDPADDNYRPLQENLERLQGATTADGEKIEVVPLPMPERLQFAGQRLPASYANFYVANDRVLVPTFNAPQDRTALGILAELFPGRQVVGIHAVDLVWGFGTLHCLTQQQPAV
jgi:agmatine deiminase